MTGLNNLAPLSAAEQSGIDRLRAAVLAVDFRLPTRVTVIRSVVSMFALVWAVTYVVLATLCARSLALVDCVGLATVVGWLASAMTAVLAACTGWRAPLLARSVEVAGWRGESARTHRWVLVGITAACVAVTAGRMLL